MEFKGTPGPWSEPSEYGANGLEIIGGGISICVIQPCRIMEGARCVRTERRERAMEDAILIGAAWDMQKALREIADMTHGFGGKTGVINEIANTALARALRSAS